MENEEVQRPPLGMGSLNTQIILGEISKAVMNSDVETTPDEIIALTTPTVGVHVIAEILHRHGLTLSMRAYAK